MLCIVSICVWFECHTVELAHRLIQEIILYEFRVGQNVAKGDGEVDPKTVTK